MSALIAAALGAGLAGSVHCAAMCGPLAVAGSRKVGHALGYLGGRLAAYAAGGAFFGVVGEHALCALPIDKVQLAALIGVGVFALWKAQRALFPRRVVTPPVSLTRRPRRSLLGRIVSLLPPRGLTLGLATGILPCGMLIAAWMLAATAGTAGDGALTMVAFWAGSLPGLLVPMLARRLVLRIPPALSAVAWLGLAVWLALRPLLMSGHHH